MHSSAPTFRKKLAVMLGLGALLAACSILVPSHPIVPIVITIEAQTLPITKTLAWSASTNADSYIVTQDGNPAGTPTTTSQSITLTTAGPHTFTVAAKNVWGTSSATPLTVNVVLPSQPTGLGIS